VRLTLENDDDGIAVLSAEMDLRTYDLPGSALVVVEAYRHASFMRFEWGTVAQLVARPNRRLTEFGSTEGVQYRVRIVESPRREDARAARILAVAEHLRPRHLDETQRRSQSLLAIEFADSLEEVWKLQFDPNGDDEPLLLVNRHLVADKGALARSDQFVTLALPQILRSILSRILLEDHHSEFDYGTDWRTLWLRLACALPGVADPPRPRLSPDGQSMENPDEIESWIDSAVSGFARKFQISQRFRGWWTEPEAA